MISMVDRISPKWMGLSGAIVFSLGALIGFYGFPALIRSQIASNLALKKGSDIRTLWEKVPDPIDFKVYVFNVTNPQEVQRGQMPVLNEIGPYFYGEYKEKVNLVDQNKDDTVFFNPVDTWVFNKERSGGLTGDEMLTVPHAALLAMAITVEREKPAALKLLNKAIPHLFGQPTSIFVTAPARQILFGGLPIVCNGTDFSAKAICSEIRKQADSFQKLDENVFGFSFFGLKNGTAGGRFQVKRGIQNISEVGQVQSFNGKPKQTVWSGDQCNKYAGTDSTIFAPFLTKESKIVAFAPDLCRSIAAGYEGIGTYRGIDGYRFTANFGDPSSDPELKCFCTTPETCPKKGVHDLLPCTGAPIMASLPHFYLADESYQRAVIGLRPTKEEHEITMQFEPMTATPLVAYKRLQFNIDIHSIDKIDLMQQTPTLLLPILWVQEGLELKQEYIDKVAAIFKVMSIVDVLKWLMMVLGGGLGAASAGLLQLKKSADTVHNDVPSSNKTGVGVAPLEVTTPTRY